jgi:hypothetical protein
MDVLELVRLLRRGASDRTLTQALGLNRRTIAKYRRWAQDQRLLEGSDLPGAAELEAELHRAFPSQTPPQQTSSLVRFRDEIAALRERGMEIAAIRGRLEERHCEPVSYSAVWRLVHRLEGNGPKPGKGEPFVRVETAAGQEAQVDFGYAGRALDPLSGALRKSWVFTLVLSYSRHQYAELVFDQRVETWLLCHRHAFDFFGGVPARIVPDNLKAAVIRASLHEPVAQRAYRECALHYGFLIDPNPPKSPHLKGKVEKGGVHYVKRNFLAGRDPEPLDVRNAKLRAWCTAIAGQRIHGTTRERPLTRFERVERPALQPLPPTPYDLAVWGRARVYRDCHLTFQGAYYSAPFRLVGQDLWVRAGARTVELYTKEHALVATHDRASAPGQRKTLLAHLPPEKVPGLTLNREDCRAQAQAIGPATAIVVGQLLDHRPEDRLRPAGRLVRLATQYAADRVERACARALAYGTGDFVSVRRILQAGLDGGTGGAEHADDAAARGRSQLLLQVPLQEAPPPPSLPSSAPRPPARGFAFVRHTGEFVAALLGASRAASVGVVR